MQRRTFLRAGVTAAGALALAAVHGANRRLNFGVIGCRNMGRTNLRSFLKTPETRCVALCDVDAGILEERAAGVQKRSGTTPRLYRDHRALLDDPDIDAVIVASPDHWHCLHLVDAVDAGKHVYLEKPVANAIGECTPMLAAQQRTGRLVQVGQWQRSGQHWQDAIGYLRSGALGTVRTVKCWAYLDWLKMDKAADAPVPAGVDYDRWLGPAPARPFNPNRFHFHFRWFWDYAGGLMTDWGVHLLDIALWGMQATAPRRVMASGGAHAYPDGGMETPDTQQAIFEFDGFTLSWEHAVGIALGPFQRPHGVAFVGENGTLVVDRQGWEVLPETSRDTGLYKTPALPAREARREARGLDQHTANFIAAIRDGEALRCDLATGSLAAVNAHLGNIALRTGETLAWNGTKQRFDGSRTANALLKPTYRGPWRLPG